MPFARGPVLCYKGLGLYVTVGESEYVGRDEVFRIPAGMPTDLASIPRIFWSFLPPDGTYERAAVLHDAFCLALAKGDCVVSSRDADAIFRRVMRESRVGFVTRWILWTGVRYGALFNRHRRPGISRDLPVVFAITVAVLAVTLAAIASVDHVVHALIHAI